VRVLRGLFREAAAARPGNGCDERGVSRSPPAGPGIGVGALVVTAPVTAAGVYGLMRGHGPTESAHIANYQPAIVNAPLAVGKIIDRTNCVVFLAAVVVAMPDDPGTGAGESRERSRGQSASSKVHVERPAGSVLKC
jgi:hypothetical protein